MNQAGNNPPLPTWNKGQNFIEAFRKNWINFRILLTRKMGFIKNLNQYFLHDLY